VKRIQWSRGRVNAQVIAEQPGPSSFEARAVLVTVPLPHLQRHDALGFDPEIPVIRGAARRLAMGQVLRLTLSFAQRVWDEFGDVAFLSCPEGEFPTWWTGMQGASVITAWAGGPKAESLLAESPDCLVETALRALHNILRVPEAQLRRSLRRHYFHDWSRDPFAQGAYSYTPVNSFDARYTLSTPIDNTLFFAGEATNIAGEHGTVHGALDSGVAAARRILTAMETPE
jgi:monoamine oxidase